MKTIQKLSFVFTILSFLATNSYCQNYNSITQNVDTLNGGALGGIYLISPNAISLATIGNTTISYCAASSYGQGKAIAVGHDGFLVDGQNYFDNYTFIINSMKWLNSSKKSILIKNGFANANNMTTVISILKAEGYTIKSTSNKIQSSDLDGIGIVLFGNDWNNGESYSESEVSAIKNFAEEGGGVFIAGLGWSYGNSMDVYSMNNIAEIFGLKFSKDCIPVDFVTSIYPATKDLTVFGSIKNIKNITATYASNLISILQNDESVKKTYSNSNSFLRNSLEYLELDNPLRDTIYNFYTQLINNYPILKKGQAYNTTNETAFIYNRELIQVNLQNSIELTPDVINEIGNTLGLSGRYLEIWNKYQMLLVDNSKLDEPQLKFTLEILDAIPSELQNLGRISFSDYLGNTNKIDLKWFSDNSVNSFSHLIGTAPENQFPNDVSAGVTSIFCSALAHEINHNVDSYYINGNTELSKRKAQLILQAGTNSANYCRGASPNTYDDFFKNNPIEFFASLSNQWFTDSKKVLELGLVRFNKNYKEPINQFLFYADVYSLGSDSTIFYTNDINANFSFKKIPIERDGLNHINKIIVDNSTYNFVLDNLGNVLDYSIDVAIDDTTTYFVSSPEFAAISPKIVLENMNKFTSQTGGDSIVNHYLKFVYDPTFFTDTTFISLTDTTYFTVTDTTFVTVMDTTFVTVSDTVSISVTDTLIIDVTLTGINSQYNTNTIKIYPNPAHSFIIINTGNYDEMSDYTIRIQNLLGQQVYKTLTNKPEFQIDINDFGGYGTYIVQVLDNLNRSVANRKIILK